MEEHSYRELAEREQTHWFCVVRREIIAAALDRAGIAPKGRVLEVGSGTGGNVELLSEYGDLTCIEPNPVGRKLARERFGDELDLRVAAWPGDEALAPDERFNLVAMLDVLEHVDDPEAALRAVREVLVPGGRVVITVPNYRWMWSVHDDQLHHHDRYTPQRLRALVAAAGMRPITIGCFNTLLFPFAGVVRLGTKILHLKSSPGSKTPSRAVNAVLRTILRWEVWFIRRGIRLPYGLSTLAILEVAS